MASPAPPQITPPNVGVGPLLTYTGDGHDQVTALTISFPSVSDLAPPPPAQTSAALNATQIAALQTKAQRSLSGGRKAAQY